MRCFRTPNFFRRFAPKINLFLSTFNANNQIFTQSKYALPLKIPLKLLFTPSNYWPTIYDWWIWALSFDSRQTHDSSSVVVKFINLSCDLRLMTFWSIMYDPLEYLVSELWMLTLIFECWTLAFEFDFHLLIFDPWSPRSDFRRRNEPIADLIYDVQCLTPDHPPHPTCVFWFMSYRVLFYDSWYSNQFSDFRPLTSCY